MALIQEYSVVFPLVNLLRRLLADGCPIGYIQVEIAHMEADGDIKFPHPREQLPVKWVLVELLLEDTPHGHKLMIVTGDWDHPIEIDPIGINCCERLSPPVIMYGPDEPRPDETHAGKAAKWLAALLKQNPKMGKKTRKEDCMQLFDITSNTYDKRAWPEAHRLAGLPMRENNAE